MVEKNPKIISADTPDVVFNADAQIKLETAHDIVQHPDKFAEVFVKAAKTQSIIKEYIRKELQESLVGDIPTKDAMKAIMAEQFRADWKSYAFSIGGTVAFAVWTLLTIWLGHIWK